MQALYDVPAPAKLNLFLHVVGKRPDGYHLLQSIFTLIDWADTLHFERRTDGLLRRHDQGDALPEDDLCLRAARLLQAESGLGMGADIHIEKRLPAGAGMGGGSSDAASTLLALNRLWGLNWALARLLPLGLKLGADVPFFLGGHNAFVEGIGEILHPVKLPDQQYAVLKPPTSIATREIFSSSLLARSKSVAIVAGFPAHNSSDAKSAADVVSFLDGFGRNDLQPPAEASCSEVLQALRLLEAQFGNSRMTGSGSAVFARVETVVDGKEGMSHQSMATILEGLPSGWVGKICRGLAEHPLRGWAEG
ncbi:MAG TPA: 4-(cytidine 5'-diphospho)-2-C-methyl-D-erythritol kinase [Roseateles sp.]|nr:4-(cytidine 5'-diphospho)-2-C-methyl-D-erythritol kinase [Roseateles sp.]